MRRHLVRALALGAAVLVGAAAPSEALPGPARVARGQTAGNFVIAETWPLVDVLQPADAWRQISGLAALDAQTVYVADADRIQPRVSLWQTGLPARVVLEGDGNCPSVPPGQLPSLCEPGALAVDAARDRLFIADAKRGGVLQTDLAGRPQAFFGGLVTPSGLAVGIDGTLHVAEADLGAVRRFDLAGSELERWQAVPTVPGGGLITGIAADDRGGLYVLDGRSPRVLVLNPGGLVSRMVDNFPGPSKLFDLTLGSAPGGSGRIVYMATSRGLLAYNERTMVFASNPVDTLTAIDMAEGTTGLWAASTDFNAGFSQLLAWDARGPISGEPLRYGGLPIPLGALQGPQRISRSPDGQAVLVTDRSSRLQRFGPDGRGISQAGAPSLEDHLQVGGRIFGLTGDAFIELEEDTERGLYEVRRSVPLRGKAHPDAYGLAMALDAGGQGVVVLDIAGRSVRHLGLDGTEGPSFVLGQPTRHWADLTVDPGGRIFVLDAASGLVVEATPGGAVDWADISRPALRIEAGADGRVHVLDDAGWVWLLDPAGVGRVASPVTRLDLSPTSRPSDLVILPGGDLLVADRGADVITRFAWDPAAPAPEPPLPNEGRCRVDLSKVASPQEIALGQTVHLQLGVAGTCSYRQLPAVDLFFVIDVSGSMAGERIGSFRQAVLDFSIWMNWSHSRMGLVTFNQTATVLAPLTTEESELRRALGGLRPFGASRIDRGLKATEAAWLASRRPGAQGVAVLVSDGRSGHAESIAAAESLKARGMALFTVNTGVGPDELALMTALATTPGHALHADDPTMLGKLLASIADRIAQRELFRSAIIADQIPDNMRYVPNSAAPAATWEPVDRRLSWSLSDVTDAGVVVGYDLEPQQAGDWPTNRAAWLEFVDGFGRTGLADFPVPQVRVIAPTPSPTATASPTPQRPPRIFLPLVLWESCLQTRKADVVLVMDSSRSMDGDKLRAAQAAAELFVGTMRLGQDRVALVTFDTQARLASPLTADGTALRAAIRGVRTQPGTHIDLGLAAAEAELNSTRRRRDATATIILLTDGVQTGERAQVLAQGRALCAAGRLLYTIGLGKAPDVDLDFLMLLACRPDMAHQAVTPELLAGIYLQIAGDIPCDPSHYWGGR